MSISVLWTPPMIVPRQSPLLPPCFYLPADWRALAYWGGDATKIQSLFSKGLLPPDAFGLASLPAQGGLLSSGRFLMATYGLKGDQLIKV
jgi:hypothetical protein